MFSLLSKINPKNINSWNKKTFLTFDIDWAHDEIISDTIDLVKQFSVPSTWFVTHDSPILKMFSLETKFELGIHPNFNPLLNGNSQKNSSDVLKECFDIVPNATSVRSHSLTQNERLIDLFRDFGVSHVSNNFIPANCGINLKPFFLWDEMVIVPHCWQDNVSLKMNLSFPTLNDFEEELYVFDFHPIHVFLNCENLNRYESTRSIHQKPDELVKYRFEGYGIRSRLIELLEMSLN